LIVADAGVGDGEPGAFAAVAAGADFDETRLQRVGVDLDFHVGGPVGHLQRVQDDPRVRRQGLEQAAVFSGGGRNERHAVIHKVRAVRVALVVDPDGHDLMFAVPRDGVDDVLVPS